MIRGFFFDLDGTLVDTHRANYRAYKQALADFGFEIEWQDFQKSIGHQARTFLPWFAPGLSAASYGQIADKKKEYYRSEIAHTNLNIRLVKFMESMKPSHKIALVTTAKRENAEAVLKHHGLSEYFDIVITAEDVSQSKPNPECYKLALKRASLQPKEVVAFEDSSVGVVAAEKAGIAVIKIEGFYSDAS